VGAAGGGEGAERGEGGGGVRVAGGDWGGGLEVGHWTAWRYLR